MIKFSEEIYDMTYNSNTNSYTFDKPIQKINKSNNHQSSSSEEHNKNINKSKSSHKSKNNHKGQIIDIYIF